MVDMSKINAEAFAKLQELIENNDSVKFDKIYNGYQITIWKSKNTFEHSHYEGSSILEVLMKVKGTK